MLINTNSHLIHVYLISLTIQVMMSQLVISIHSGQSFLNLFPFNFYYYTCITFIGFLVQFIESTTSLSSYNYGDHSHLYLFVSYVVIMYVLF